MSRASKLFAASVGMLVIAMVTPVEAGPIGTPAANRVPTGDGHALGGLFDTLVGGGDRDDAIAGDGTTPKRRKHLTSKQWHEAYRARHGHDLPSPLDRPGGH